ncbi:MAG: AAA family ATPase, partial [Actinomycetales bacterium]|nr:AAA family ATPase [Actinomycetales bacterium]
MAEVSVPLQRQGRPAVRHSTRPELVDRVVELARTGRGVIVVGDAGVGKTHLVNLVVPQLAATGARVVTVTATAARRALPLGALEPLLGDVDLLGSSAARTARAIVASLRDVSDDGGAGSQPVLRIENAHLLDEASSQVVEWLARHEDVVLLVSMRRSAASWSPWLELWRDDVLERIDIEPLDFAQTESLLVAELGGPITADTAHRLWRMTSGNVFYLAELVRDLRHSGDLARTEGVWVWQGIAGTSQRLLDVVAHDVAYVSDDVRALLEEIALGGPRPLHAVLDEHPRSAVQELLALGLVSRSEDGADGGPTEVVLRITHPLYGDAVASHTSAQRQREVLQRAVASYVARVGTPDDLLRWVNRALSHGVPVPAHVLRDGYEAAMERLSRPTAVAFATEMIRLHALGDAPNERADAVRVELLLCRGEAWRHFGSRELAQHDVREAREILVQLPLDEEVIALGVRADVLEAQVHHYRGDDLAGALRVLDDGLARVTALDTAAARKGTTRLVRERLTHLGWSGRVREALPGLLAELDAPEAGADVVPLVGPTITGLALVGRFSEIDHLAQRYLPVALRSIGTYRWGPSDIVFATYASRVWRGEAPGAEIDHLYGKGLPGTVDWTGLHLRRGFDAIAAGAWSTARAELRAANVRIRTLDVGGFARFTLAAEALAAAATGDPVGAHALAAQSREAPVRSGGSVEPQVELTHVDTMMWLR